MSEERTQLESYRTAEASVQSRLCGVRGLLSGSGGTVGRTGSGTAAVAGRKIDRRTRRDHAVVERGCEN